MRKEIAAIGVILVAGIGVIPYWGGIRAEREYAEILAKLETSFPQGKVHSTYRRGWLRSKAEVVLGGKAMDSAAIARTGAVGTVGAPALVIEHTIIHGPIPFGELLQGSFDLRPVLAKSYTSVSLQGSPTPQLASLLEGLPSLQVVTVIRFDQSGEIEIELPAFTRQLDGNASVVCKPLRGRFTASADGTWVTGHTSWPGFELTHPTAQAVAEDLRAVVEYREGADGIPLGQIRFQFARVNVESEGRTKLALTGLELAHTAEQVDGALDSVVRASVEKGTAWGREFGPGEFELSIRKLDAKTLGRIRRLLQKAKQSENTEGGEQARLRALGAIQSLFPTLLAKSPEASFRLRAVTDVGPLLMSASLGFGPKAALLAHKPLLLLTAIEAEGEVAIPVAVMDQLRGHRTPEDWVVAGAEPKLGKLHRALAERIEALVSHRLLLRTGKFDRTRLRYSEARLSINGIPIDVLQRLPTP